MQQNTNNTFQKERNKQSVSLDGCMTYEIAIGSFLDSAGSIGLNY